MKCEACNGTGGFLENEAGEWSECSQCGATGATCDVCGNPSDGLGSGNEDDRCPMCREAMP